MLFLQFAGYDAAGEAIDLFFSHYATESHLLDAMELSLSAKMTRNRVSLIN